MAIWAMRTNRDFPRTIMTDYGRVVYGRAGDMPRIKTSGKWPKFGRRTVEIGTSCLNHSKKHGATSRCWDYGR